MKQEEDFEDRQRGSASCNPPTWLEDIPDMPDILILIVQLHGAHENYPRIESINKAVLGEGISYTEMLTRATG